MASTRTPFEKLTAIHPNRRITLETGPAPVSMRLMDLFVPLGFGQRALVVAPPQAGKTTILRQIAAAIQKNHPQASLFLCLVDERPEEVTEWRMEVQGPNVKLYASSFDQESARHGRVVEQALTDAKRQAEQGKDVVILLDSLTRLARAHNMNSDLWDRPRGQRGNYGGGRTLSGGIDARALEVGRRVFGAARALEARGSAAGRHGRGCIRGAQGHRQSRDTSLARTGRPPYLSRNRCCCIEHTPGRAFADAP